LELGDIKCIASLRVAAKRLAATRSGALCMPVPGLAKKTKKVSKHDALDIGCGIAALVEQLGEMLGVGDVLPYFPLRRR